MDLIERSSGMTQRHPWELSRFQFFSDILADSHRLDSPCQILDVGAGDAWFSHQLQGRLKPGSQIVCWDSGYADHPDFSKSSPHVDGIQYVSQAPAGRFDLVLPSSSTLYPLSGHEIFSRPQGSLLFAKAGCFTV